MKKKKKIWWPRNDPRNERPGAATYSIRTRLSGSLTDGRVTFDGSRR